MSKTTKLSAAILAGAAISYLWLPEWLRRWSRNKLCGDLDGRLPGQCLDAGAGRNLRDDRTA